MSLSTTGQRGKAASLADIHQISRWIAQMRLPQRLHEVDVREMDLSEVEQLVFASSTVRNNPLPLRDVAQLEALLREAW
jgi:alcohol dehydrogenase class IV